MEKIDEVLAKACKVTPCLPEYDPKDQYAEPFGCETARPGNYFKQAGLTDTFRQAFIQGRFPEQLADTAYDMIEKTEDVSWAKAERDQNRQLIGTMRMLLRRWARGGRGEALAMIEYGYVSDSTALTVASMKLDKPFENRQELDEYGHIDFVSADNELVQVKTTKNKPTYNKNKDYEKLVWVTPEYEIIEVE